MMSSFGDNVMQNALAVPGISASAYEALLISTEPYAPEMLRISSICYKLLNDDSKNKIAEFIKNDPDLREYYNKYILLTGLMKNELTDPMVFFKANKALVTPLLASLHINTENISVDSLKLQLNNHIQDMITKIKDNKKLVLDVLGKVRIGGNRTKFKNGKRKSRMKRKRTFRNHRR